MNTRKGKGRKPEKWKKGGSFYFILFYFILFCKEASQKMEQTG